MSEHAQWYNNIIYQLSGYHTSTGSLALLQQKISENKLPMYSQISNQDINPHFYLSSCRYDWDVMDALMKIVSEMLAGHNVLPHRAGACVLRCPFTLSIHQAWMKRWR